MKNDKTGLADIPIRSAIALLKTQDKLYLSLRSNLIICRHTFLKQVYRGRVSPNTASNYIISLEMFYEDVVRLLMMESEAKKLDSKLKILKNYVQIIKRGGQLSLEKLDEFGEFYNDVMLMAQRKGVIYPSTSVSSPFRANSGDELV